MDDLRLRDILLPRDHGSGAERGQRALVVTAVLTAVAAFIVGLRLYARVGLMKLSGREDWTILAALTFSFVYLGLVVAQAHFGLGRHSDDLPPEILMKQLQRLWVAIPMYNFSLCFSKLSILFQYLRIFPNRWFRVGCYVMMGIVGTYSIWAIVSGFLNCVPVAKFWDRTIPGYCLSFEAVWFFNASMNIATDLTLLIMPMPVLSQLQLPKMQKVLLMAVFAIGGLVVITSILRLSSLREVSRSQDTSYSNVDAAFWTAAECNVAIICACLPFLRPIISHIFPKFLSTNSYLRHTSGHITVSRSATRQRSQMFSQVTSQVDNGDYDMYSINVKPGDSKHHNSNIGGIEVITEMVQETSKYGESTSERGLVLDPQPQPKSPV